MRKKLGRYNKNTNNLTSNTSDILKNVIQKIKSFVLLIFIYFLDNWKTGKEKVVRKIRTSKAKVYRRLYSLCTGS